MLAIAIDCGRHCWGGEELVSEQTRVSSLLFNVRAHICALPLNHVIETMRPLPVVSLPGIAAPVLGVSIIRGEPMPVVDPGRLLDGTPSQPTRFITLRIAERHIALSVDDVQGVRTMDAASLQECPPLLRDASRDLVASIATLDAELLFVLNAARIVPDTAWHAVDAWGGTT
ncbi:MAG TPA: chemotaxis protein CheW [Burkholderiales bacterium]|jgi:Chemotaxis signal transduction protein